MKLGAKIRLLRTLKGYSQEAMAELLKLSVTGYGKIERSETDVTVSRISQIADTLGITVEDILQFDGNDAFQKYSGSGLRLANSTPPKGYHNAEEIITACKAIYESRIIRLENEVLEMRKLLVDVIKNKE